MHARIHHRITRRALGFLITALTLATALPALARGHARGAVFTISNEAEGNRVLSYARDAHGALSEPVAYDTGGLGSGDSLGSQAALVLSDNYRYLIAVNAGSNDISSFRVEGAQLKLVSRVTSGGVRPVSVTERRGLVYVVNAGEPSNVSGFYLDRRGKLWPVPGSRALLSTPTAAPGQVELSRDARTLIVTEKDTNVIDTFAVGAFGALGARRTTVSAGMTPFGFELTQNDTLIVSEAASASMSSYAIAPDAALRVISAAVPDNELAPCWVAVSRDGRFAFTANAGSESVSSYSVADGGAIALLDARAADLGPDSRPLDMAVSADGRFLYVVDRGNAEVAAFAMARDGTLSPLDVAAGLTPFASGAAAY